MAVAPAPRSTGGSWARGSWARGSWARGSWAIACWVLVALATCTLLPAKASAHLLPPQNATIHAVGDKVYAVVSVPVSALAGVDDDGDGELSAAELRRHQADISHQFIAALPTEHREGGG